MSDFNQSIPPNAVPARARFIRQPEVLVRTGVSWMTLVRWEKQGCFPKRHKIGPNIVAWLESDIDSWCAQRTVDIANASGAV